MAYDKVVDSAVLNTGLTKIANAIREKGGTSAGLAFPDAMAEAIAAIEVGRDIDPIPAFVSAPAPLSNELQVKNIVPLPKQFTFKSAYTNTDSMISVDFPYGMVGDRHILAFSTRKPSSEPILPSGWTKIAWISPCETSISDQYLLVASLTTDDNNAGSTGTIAFDVVNGERSYLMVINIGDSNIDTVSPIITKTGNSITVETSLFEHTLLICSSETAKKYGKPWHVEDGLCFDFYPIWDDGNVNGGRLAAKYIPYLSQQPYSKLNIIPGYLNNSEPAATLEAVQMCAIRVIPGTPDSYCALL